MTPTSGGGGQGDGETRPVARPLIPVVLALMGGIIAADGGLRLPWGWLLGAALGLLLLMALSYRRSRRVLLLPLAFFALLGLVLYQQAVSPALPRHHIVYLPQEQDLHLLGRLSRPSKSGGERLQLFLRVEAAKTPSGWQTATGVVLLLAPPMEPPPLGTRLVVRGRLTPPRVLQNPAAFNRARYLAADGIFREMHLRQPEDLVLLATHHGHPLGEKLRGGIRSLLRELDPVSRAIYLAMLLGDQGEISPEQRRAFARTGTSHLLVINGLHLSMVAGVVYFLTFWGLRRFPWLLLRVNVMKISTLMAALAVVGYAWVSGGSPSTQRAEIMVLAYLLLVFLGRPREVWSALALAAFVILMLSPLRLFFISFQLSFAAVAALLWVMPRLVDHRDDEGAAARNLPRRLIRLIKEWLLVSVVAAVATAPLVAHYFQVVSFMGVVVNVLAIPLVLGLALPLGEAAVLAQALTLTPVAKVLLYLGNWPVWLGYQLIDHAARLPGAAVGVPPPSWLQILACYVLLAGLAAPRHRWWTWAGAALAGMILAASVAIPMLYHPRELEITVLDTHGSLAGVVVTPDGRRLVLSAPAPSWPGRQITAPGPLPAYLHGRQWRRLDHLLALTLSQGNATEIMTLVQQFHVGAISFGRWGAQGPAFWELWNHLGERGRTPRSLSKGASRLSLGEVTLTFPDLGQAAGVGLILLWQHRAVVVLPPLRRSDAATMAPPRTPAPAAVMILPAALHDNHKLTTLVEHYHPKGVILYGGSRQPLSLPAELNNVPIYLTSQGAVRLLVSATAVSLQQYKPAFANQ